MFADNDNIYIKRQMRRRPIPRRFIKHMSGHLEGYDGLYEYDNFGKLKLKKLFKAPIKLIKAVAMLPVKIAKVQLKIAKKLVKIPLKVAKKIVKAPMKLVKKKKAPASVIPEHTEEITTPVIQEQAPIEITEQVQPEEVQPEEVQPEEEEGGEEEAEEEETQTQEEESGEEESNYEDYHGEYMGYYPDDDMSNELDDHTIGKIDQAYGKKMIAVIRQGEIIRNPQPRVKSKFSNNSVSGYGVESVPAIRYPIKMATNKITRYGVRRQPVKTMITSNVDTFMPKGILSKWGRTRG